jgi:hypothetical protein
LAWSRHFFWLSRRRKEEAVADPAENTMMQLSGVLKMRSSALYSPTLRKWKILAGIQERDDDEDGMLDEQG